MKKSSLEKANEVKIAKKDSKRITFQLEKSSLQCFMSKQVGCKSKKVEDLKMNKDGENQSKQILGKQLSTLFNRRKASSFISSSYKSFNNRVLLMQYGKDQVYVDSTKKQGQVKSKTPSPKHEEDAQEEYDFQTPCVRVITEQTNHTSNPLSARFTPQEQSVPGSSRIYQSEYTEQVYYTSISTRNKRSISYQQSKAYVIDLDNIENDGRSTIMVRNIPNKYTQDMLLKLFSQNHKKKFDFFYLPMDYKVNLFIYFQNSCNVGYAFVNFIHAKFIRDFYLQFHSKKWQKFNSQKICHVCYARIQGTVQLAYHFENSKVIQQKDKKVRPLGLNDTMYINLSSLVQRQKEEL